MRIQTDQRSIRKFHGENKGKKFFFMMQLANLQTSKNNLQDFNLF